jgi:hypothetical protein
MYQIADKEDKWDKPISQLNFEAEIYDSGVIE